MDIDFVICSLNKATRRFWQHNASDFQSIPVSLVGRRHHGPTWAPGGRGGGGQRRGKRIRLGCRSLAPSRRDLRRRFFLLTLVPSLGVDRPGVPEDGDHVAHHRDVHLAEVVLEEKELESGLKTLLCARVDLSSRRIRLRRFSAALVSPC